MRREGVAATTTRIKKSHKVTDAWYTMCSGSRKPALFSEHGSEAFSGPGTGRFVSYLSVKARSEGGMWRVGMCVWECVLECEVQWHQARTDRQLHVNRGKKWNMCHTSNNMRKSTQKNLVCFKHKI